MQIAQDCCTDSNVSRKCRYLIGISIYQINEKVTGGETVSDYPLTLQEKQLQSAILQIIDSCTEVNSHLFQWHVCGYTLSMLYELRPID